jgi:hypothetical protein
MYISTFYGQQNTTITEFLDIIHGPVFYLKHNILETGLCLQVKAYSVGHNRYS